MEIDFSNDEKEGIKQVLEMQPAENVGVLRTIDRVCEKIEKEEELEVSDINFIKSKVNSFSNFNPIKKYRKIIISLSDKIDTILNTNGK